MEKEPEFSEGDTVRVKEGAFTSFSGEVTNVDGENKRLSVKGRFELQPGSDLALLNVSFSVLEKLARVSDSSQEQL